ncbi:DUF2235 domain-containing protein [Photobacterium sp. SDRW27]|uniref:DUF2235 domain-containing protein n=1 Tax=Photobacterium obscurum TaxID=2829490 RepID=UPI002244545C|nr:DUF2235 domain-containing protein [Photobacterium obscurum]MCW8331381.1 DUF2235 domain-containing protein [Photobacterium obscurum]
MAYLIVCCDGTWNDPGNNDDGAPAPTNVRQLFNFLKSIPRVQETRYQSGVGTGGVIDKVVGGILGFGLSEDIRDCYQWLADKYQAGDEILLFGFSRGAYTARSLAGMITRLGIVDFNRVAASDREKVVKHVYKEGYREKESKAFLETHFDISFHDNSDNVLFLGVWDTVGALGIPNDKALLDLFDNPKNYEFHDVTLNHNVKHARHAVAIDEERGSFSPTLWEDEPDHPHSDLKQLWFAGVHSDIGGGYKENGLSDCALEWMKDEINSVTELQWEQSLVDQVEPNPKDELHESHLGLMKVLVTAPRAIPDLDTNEDAFHQSVIDRRNDPPPCSRPLSANKENFAGTIDNR